MTAVGERWLALAALLPLGACHAGPTPPPPRALVVATDSAVYHRRGQSRVTIAFTITNGGERPLYLWQCADRPAAIVDRLSLGVWRFLDGEYCNGGASRFALAPGQSAHGAVVADAGGNYRLRVGAATTPNGDGEFDVPSPAFDVR